MPRPKKTVIISSTSVDLPEHRKEAMDACLRQGIRPLAMEHLPARDVAVAAATEAYRQAWCDGPPYAYHFGLTNARRHLQELDAPEPEMPSFDASKYEPMPEVELDPEDEFHVGTIAEA